MSMLTYHPLLPDSIESVIRASDKPDVNKRIIDAYRVSVAYAEQLEEGDFAQAVRAKLIRSYVHGSRLEGIYNYEDVIQMLSDVENWQEVIANLEDKTILCFQGQLPESYTNRAYAAYATIKEIAQLYGAAGLSSIQIKKGYQEEDGFYLCTMANAPTDIITVQLTEDGNRTEHLKQWFAGIEKSSILHQSDGDTLVRCSSRMHRVNGNFRRGTSKHSAS